MSISNVNHLSTWVTCASMFLHDLCLCCPCLVQHTMFRFLSSFSIIFLIPMGKLSCASFQHIASNLTLVMSSLASRLEIVFTLVVDHDIPSGENEGTPPRKLKTKNSTGDV